MAEWLNLQSRRFTSSAAFIREVLALLESTDYKLQLVIKADEIERLDAEISGMKTLGRVKVKVSEEV